MIETLKKVLHNLWFKKKVPYSDYDRAIEAAKRGEVQGVVHFGQNFTDHLVVRQSERNDASYETIIGSQISISLDQSSN
jgi:hypothetical protein